MKFFALALIGAASAITHHHSIHNQRLLEIEMSEEPVAEAAAAAGPAGPKAGTPADSYKQKADSLKAVTAAVAEQERFMAAHNKMVADNFSADDNAAKTERARVSRARQTQLQGGLAY